MLGYLGGEGNPDSDSDVEQQSAKVQCVVALAGVFEFLGAGRMALFGHGSPENNDGSPEALIAQEASSITHISAGDPPTLLVHGTEDDISRSERLRDALQTAGVPVKLFPVPGSGHGPNYPGAEIENSVIQAEYAAWFDKHLKK
jgi:dipeptidyl aminopeptidase/acylaminoacyl peptidase